MTLRGSRPAWRKQLRTWWKEPGRVSEVLCAQDGPLQGEGLLPEPKQRK